MNLKLLFFSQELSLLRSSYDNNDLSCTLERPKSAGNGRIDIELPKNLLFAKAQAYFGK